jgi:hypothetical protein
MTGISIGSSYSGILANSTLLMGEIDMLDRLVLITYNRYVDEIDMLDRLETKGMVLITYNRYVDDITTISDVKEHQNRMRKENYSELFLILEDELNK